MSSLTIASPKTTQAASSEPRKKRLTVGRIIGWAFMLIILFITLFPFYWILRTALSSNSMLATNPDSLLPVGTNLGGFGRVFGKQDVATAVAQGGSGASMNFWRYLLNSVVVATMITVAQTLSCAMAAYAFARLKWRGRDTIFAIFLGAMMIPSIFALLPNFVLMKHLHLIDTLLGIMLPTLLIILVIITAIQYKLTRAGQTDLN